MKKWYDNKIIVYVALIVFFPVGLYALWKNKEFSQGMKIGLTAIVLLIVFMIGKASPPPAQTSNTSEEIIQEPTLTQAQKDSLEVIREANREAEMKQKLIDDRKEMIDKQFSGYTGVHYELESLIKKNLNDPDSYEHVETNAYDKGDYLIVVTKYRAKNGFGALMLKTTTAKVSIEGVILEVK